MEVFCFTGFACEPPQPDLHLRAILSPKPAWQFLNQEDPNIDPKYYHPDYGDPQNGTRIWGHHQIRVSEKQSRENPWGGSHPGFPSGPQELFLFITRVLEL